MTALRGILKSPSVFPLEHELRSFDEPRARSRSRDRRHPDEALQLVVPSTSTPRRDKSPSARSVHSRRTVRSRRRSHSRSRRHVRWSDPIEFVVSDGKDMLSRELRHRRSSLPSILEDTRTAFRESLREQDKKQEDSHASASSSSSSSSRRRPPLKNAVSSPDVGRASQEPHPSKPVPAQTQVHAPTPISSEHRKRRTSLPNGLEAAVKSPSHALWLPHHSDQQQSDHPTPNVNDHSSPLPPPHPASSQSHTNGHSRQQSSERPSYHSTGYARPIPQTPYRQPPALLPPHVREQPNLHGRGLAPPPLVTFMNQQPSPAARPISQITTSTQRSAKSSPPEQRPSPLPLPAPPLASPNPPAKVSPAPSPKQINEPATPRSTKSSLLSTKSSMFSFPTIDDVFSKEDTSHSKLSIRRLFGLSTPKHEPRKLDEEDKPVKTPPILKERTKEPRRQEAEKDVEPERRRTTSNPFLVHPPAREPLHRSRHSFDLGTFSLLDDMHMRWTTATARHFLPVLTPAEIQASQLTLHLNPALTTIHWDIRHPTNAVWSVAPGQKTKRWSGYDEPATVPLVPTLRVISSYFPWVITARNPNGVTCGDVLSAIHASARQLVWRGEFDQLRTADKNRLAAGYHANRPSGGELMSADAPFEAGSWLVRADWLGRYTVLRGMSVNETRDRYGKPGDVLLNMYLVENKKEKPFVVRP